MKIPLINLIIKQNLEFEGYKKTVCFNPNTLELSLEDTSNITDAKKCFTYEILEPLNFEEKTKLIYKKSNMSFEMDLYVPIFNAKSEKLREKYLNGSQRLIEIIKYPTINNVFSYSVESIEAFSFAGTETIGNEEKDVINLQISFYNGFTETEKGSDLINRKVRNQIKDTISDSAIDSIILNLNNNRTNKLEYRYHILNGVSYLLDFNLSDIISKEQNISLDFSFFDKISINMAFDIIFYNLKGLSRNNISIIINEEQFETLKLLAYTEKTWKNYLKKGRFIIK